MYNFNDLDTFTNAFASKQARMYAFQKIQRDAKKNDDILSQSTTWINTSKKDLKDERTGKRVRARTIYAGRDGEKYPTWETPVANLDRMIEANQVLNKMESASKTEIDNALYNPFEKEFQGPLTYYNDILLAEESAAAPMTSQDFPLINNVTVAGQVIINQQTIFPLLDAVNVENTTNLVFRRYTAEGFDIDAVVPELGTTEPKKMSFAKTEWYTRKSGGEIQWTDEFEMQDFLINPLQLARGQFTIGANKIKNNKIMKALTLFGTIAGQDVTAWTSDHPTFNPYTYFADAMKTINYTGFGRVDTGAMNSATLFAILSNDYVKGIMNTQGISAQNGATAQIPGIQGITFHIDESLPTGSVYLFDSNLALTRIQGPIRTEQYRLAREGGSGLVYRDWNDVQVRDLTKAKTIVGLV